ncbi:hypothetical protein ASPTUDRAFT_589609 [Aspergillus tubingensis CBS 134.48]|uniref:Uncharacterized protein n=1 Tax=Aspergillus tubingensis (strain CBS 134.48) TaxID=767770 RepID=A0A1L9N906_ASPTC|nr:hypothetical protein ASPTUDRAFT_589609 [Aspergillus tubingensis CBS 134.48]
MVYPLTTNEPLLPHLPNNYPTPSRANKKRRVRKGIDLHPLRSKQQELQFQLCLPSHHPRTFGGNFPRAANYPPIDGYNSFRVLRAGGGAILYPRRLKWS